MLATLLASIMHGLKNELTPPEAISGNAYEQLDPTLTNSWHQALDLFADCEVLAEALGRGFHHVYHANRLAERDQTMQTVSPLEYDWYLRHV